MANIDKLREVMMRLRDPQTGCAWDLQQDFRSIAPYTIEEAYEVADAIGRDDMPGLRDELGDLLLQVVFHARMAEETGHFDFDDVAASVTDKLVRRHPHVFGDAAERDAGIQKGSWERIKADERAAAADGSALAGVARALPALKRAQKLGKRAAHVGFDWPDLEGVREKIREELDELDEAIGTRRTGQIEEEFGDMLFAIVNLARHLDIDPEQALSVANAKFEQRFRDMERAIRASGKSFKDYSLAALDQEWRAAKQRIDS
ncbi:MAG: nucleoside triphosphate pyrophosphohydrolase [Gammaproteobacteria bacterium]|nr:nucleoside triphosphate pyrophosphohydrolase [Gammaproteobacteria bacterium]